MTADPNRLTLYGSFTSSSSFKPMMFLSLARLPFSFRTVNLKLDAQKEDWYLAINRYGQVPALKHRGLVVVQSNIILDYLARETGCFLPASEQDQWRAREWLSWEADAITNVATVRYYNRFRKAAPAVMDYFTPLATSALDVVETALAGRDWLVDDTCTIADLGCWGRMVFMDEAGLNISRWPNIESWSKRIAAITGYDHPYSLIPKKDREFDPE